MSGLIKGTTTGWGGFLFTAIVYMAIDALTEFVSWLQAIGKEGFSNVTMFDWLLLAGKMGIGSFIVLRALMNGSYGEAKEQTPST